MIIRNGFPHLKILKILILYYALFTFFKNTAPGGVGNRRELKISARGGQIIQTKGEKKFALPWIFFALFTKS